MQVESVIAVRLVVDDVRSVRDVVVSLDKKTSVGIRGTNLKFTCNILGVPNHSV